MTAITTAKKRLERCSVVLAAVRYPHPRPEHALSTVSPQLNRMPRLGRAQVADLRFDAEALS